MKNFHFFCVCVFSFFTTFYASEPAKTGVVEKGKALALLEKVDDLLSKAEFYLPCKKGLNSTNLCDGKKSANYIKVSKKLISHIKENLPSCPKVTAQYDKPTDCSEILANGHKENGVYTIWPKKPYTNGKTMQVYCDMKTNGGGWTVIQRRGKFPVQVDFYRDWDSYTNGFGTLTEEFWLGNEVVRVLCQNGCKIIFELEDKDGMKGFALYQNFKLSAISFNISISDYEGDIGDGMQYHNEYAFSTRDKGDTTKASELRGGWWYNDNIFVHLNGIYQPGESGYEGIVWWTWRQEECLASVEIKVKPN